jgi:hypothetical protein
VSTFVLCRVISECRSIGRKRKVVIDSLRAVDVRDRISLRCQELRDTVCSRSCIVTTDSHEKLDIIVLEEVKVEVFFKILV